MQSYVADLMGWVKAKNPAEPEFHQAVEEVAESLTLVLDRHPEFRKNKIRFTGEIFAVEPEPVTHSMRGPPYSHLRIGILRLYTAHIFGAALRR